MTFCTRNGRQSGELWHRIASGFPWYVFKLKWTNSYGVFSIK